MSKTKYFYLYKIVNKKTGSHYIGVHETYNLNDGYMGSGTIISRAIQKYGRDTFEKTIIEFFDSREDMYNKEATIVTEEYLKNPETMNIVPGGTGGSMLYNQKPFTGPHSEATRKKLSAIRKGKTLSEETRKKISDNNFSKRDPTEQSEHAVRAGKARWRSSENNQQIEQSKKKISESLQIWNQSNIRTEQTKQKMSESQIRRRKQEKESSTNKMWIHNPIEQTSKMIKCNEIIPLGWIKGRKMKFE